MTRVLVVDDEPDELALLATHLHRAGCEVVEATSAEAALAGDLAVDVAFVDLRLPGMGGWELITVLRERLPGIPVVVTSVLDEHDYPVADAVLPKPYTSTAFLAVLERVLPGGHP